MAAQQISESFYIKLKQITKGNVTREAEDLCCYGYDATGECHLPQAVVFPADTQEVSKIMTLASHAVVPVIPRGSGSGMTGGTLPIHGGIVLSTSRMNRIIEIDEANLIAVVEPGVVTGAFHKAVEEKGLFYPPDPASSAFCTIGGNLGECAGGPRAVKYGVTRDYVMGLEAVLPSGKIIHTGVKTAKGVAGYDLTRLIVGSEGTLAVVTRCTLKLLPLPRAVKTMAALFPSLSLAAQAVSAIIKESVIPRCVEFLDRSSISCVRDQFGFEVTEGTEAILIIEVDGSPAVVAEDGEKLHRFCQIQGASNVVTATDKNEAAMLWKARKALSTAMFKIAPDKINEDIVVPLSRIPEMVHRIEEIQKKTGLPVVTFGHAGDGNIHCNIMYDRRKQGEGKAASLAMEMLFDATLALGGTITGEHGVGTTKKGYLPKEIGKSEIEMMRGIKKVFDPQNILNPGKIF